MAPAIVQTIAGQGSTAAITAVLPSTPTVGNLLCLLVIEAQSGVGVYGTPSISGSPGGNFTNRGSPARGQIADRPVTSGDTTTVTVNQTGSAALRFLVAEVSGMDTSSPFDQSGTAVIGGTATSLAVPAAGAVAQNDEFAMCCVGQNGTNGGDVAATDGFTLYTTSTDTRRTFATKILSAGGTPNPTLSWTTARGGQGLIATWKAAAAVAGLPFLVMQPPRRRP